jgi:hypothetical protein
MDEFIDDNVQAVGDEPPWFQDSSYSKPFMLAKTVDVRADFSRMLTVT